MCAGTFFARASVAGAVLSSSSSAGARFVRVFLLAGSVVSSFFGAATVRSVLGASRSFFGVVGCWWTVFGFGEETSVSAWSASGLAAKAKAQLPAIKSAVSVFMAAQGAESLVTWLSVIGIRLARKPVGRWTWRSQ